MPPAAASEREAAGFLIGGEPRGAVGGVVAGGEDAGAADKAAAGVIDVFHIAVVLKLPPITMSWAEPSEAV